MRGVSSPLRSPAVACARRASRDMSAAADAWTKKDLPRGAVVLVPPRDLWAPIRSDPSDQRQVVPAMDAARQPPVPFSQGPTRARTLSPSPPGSPSSERSRGSPFRVRLDDFRHFKHRELHGVAHPSDPRVEDAWEREPGACAGVMAAQAALEAAFPFADNLSGISPAGFTPRTSPSGSGRPGPSPRRRRRSATRWRPIPSSRWTPSTSSRESARTIRSEYRRASRSDETSPAGSGSNRKPTPTPTRRRVVDRAYQPPPHRPPAPLSRAETLARAARTSRRRRKGRSRERSWDRGGFGARGRVDQHDKLTTSVNVIAWRVTRTVSRSTIARDRDRPSRLPSHRTRTRERFRTPRRTPRRLCRLRRVVRRAATPRVINANISQRDRTRG